MKAKCDAPKELTFWGNRDKPGKFLCWQSLSPRVLRKSINRKHIYYGCYIEKSPQKLVKTMYYNLFKATFNIIFPKLVKTMLTSLVLKFYWYGKGIRRY